jgi:cytidine deaminase
MKQIDLHTKISVFENKDALPLVIHDLMTAAEKARENAYAPYSKFRVGAAILLNNGEVVTGNNQENAAYPSGLCAERVAVFFAGSQYPNAKILQIAVTARSEKQVLNKPVSPCGACRQSIAEYEFKQNHPIEIFFMGETGQVFKTDSIKDLLPFLFDSSQL